MKTPRISMVVAMDEARGIGKTTLGVGKLLWDIPADMKHFRDLTTGHVIIMGRKTFESILSYRGKPLPKRTNVVITRSKEILNQVQDDKNVIVCNSIEEALEEAKKIEKEEIFIIGGGQIYTQALPLTDRLYVTLVDGVYGADTFFPDYTREFKREVKKEEPGESNGFRYRFRVLER